MIIRRHQDQLLLIRQPDHARLSRTIMAAWTWDGFARHPRRDVILLATQEHDNGWAELDEAPIVDPRTGRLLDFIQAPEEVRQSVWPRGVDRLAGEPYAAALVAQHALNVYRDNRELPGWSDFMRRMEELRTRYLALAAPRTLDDLLADYFYVRMGDLISLFFASHWPGPRVEGAFTVKASERGIAIAPDPFDGTAVPLTVSGRLVPAGPYADAADARRTYDAAATVTISASAHGS